MNTILNNENHWRLMCLERIAALETLPINTLSKAKTDLCITRKAMDRVSNILQYYYNLWIDGYKVVRKLDNGKLVSSEIKEALAMRTYKIHEITEQHPNYGPFTVFTTLKAAACYAYGNPALHVFTCRYRISAATAVWIQDGPSTELARLSKWTALAREVQLVAQVSQEDIDRALRDTTM